MPLLSAICRGRRSPALTIPIFAIYLALILGGYLLGSFPTGYLVGRLNGIDVRDYGSGKTGGTNVLRTLGWGAMIVVAVADAIKGLVTVVLAQQVTGSPIVVVLCGVAVVAGHNWPIYIKFKGGSGVGTAFGVLIGIAPLAALILITCFLIPVLITRYMSLGSIIAALLAPIVVLFLVRSDYLPMEYAVFAVVGASLVLWRHRGNMRRLLNGTERKIGERVTINRTG
jgi:glycerol-3-phosphate acyltransferase PlsY